MSDKGIYFNKANELYDRIAAIHAEKKAFWMENVLFTWQWWFGVTLTVIP